MSFLHWVDGLSLTGSVELLLPQAKRSQVRWFRQLIRMPPGCLPSEVFWAHLPGRRPGPHWTDYVSHLAWEHNIIPRRSWKTLLGRGASGIPSSGCRRRDPTPDEQEKMDVWMEMKTKIFVCHCGILCVDWWEKNELNPFKMSLKHNKTFPLLCC